MARLNVAAAGNAETNANLINARFQAEALRRLRGHDCGVLDNSFYSSANTTGLSRSANANFMWPLNATNVQSIIVGRGMATAYGYDIQSEDDVTLVGTAPSSGTKYLFVYLEWDLSNPVEAVGSLLLHDNGASASWTPPYQDNLITNPIGKYQMPLYRLAVNTSGTITATANWKALGVLTVGFPLRAENANRAEHADGASYAGTNTADGTIDDRLKSLDTRLSKLGFKEGNVTKADGTVVGKLTRTGNYVIGKLWGITFPKGSSITYYVPADFRPAADTWLLTITCYDVFAAGLVVKPNGEMVASSGDWVNRLDPIYTWGENAPTQVGYEVPPRT